MKTKIVNKSDGPVTDEEIKQIEKEIQRQSKTLDVENIEDAKNKVSDIKVVGDGNLFQLLCKASSKEQGWMKSTKAMEIKNEDGEVKGCVVQCSTQQGDNVAESLVYVPEVKIVSDENGGRKLVKL